MKKDVKEVIQGEEPHLNNLLSPEDLSSFKGMVDELRDTWTKKQLFRTETEARFSVLQDNRYPTKAAKYWQCVREQNVFLENLMSLSFDYRRNAAKIKRLEKKVEEEKNEYKKELYLIDPIPNMFGCPSYLLAKLCASLIINKYDSDIVQLTMETMSVYNNISYDNLCVLTCAEMIRVYKYHPNKNFILECVKNVFE